MNMIVALDEAIAHYSMLHDRAISAYENELTYDEKSSLVGFYREMATEDALMVESLQKAAQFIESHGLLDRAAQMRYTALEMANEKIEELERIIAEDEKRFIECPFEENRSNQ